MTGIIGSGFGLYGYLPALVQHSNEKIALLSKAYETFKNRPELQFCEQQIVWIDNEDDFFDAVGTVIFCVPPDVQTACLTKYSNRSNIKRIVLEKPVAVSPEISDEFLHLLLRQHKSIRVGYTFQFLDWGKQLINIFQSTPDTIKNISIRWSFKAHHYKNNLSNWKRYNSAGGAVIRFYGIHIIALLAQLGYTNVLQSESRGFTNDDLFLWKALFSNDHLPPFNILVDSNADTENFNLSIDYKKELNKEPLIVSMPNPFGGNNFDGVDERTGLLTQLIGSFDNTIQSSSYFNFYFKVNELWSLVESIDQRQPGKT